MWPFSVFCDFTRSFYALNHDLNDASTVHTVVKLIILHRFGLLLIQYYYTFLHLRIRLCSTDIVAFAIRLSSDLLD
jgi:hypothetical protein